MIKKKFITQFLSLILYLIVSQVKSSYSIEPDIFVQSTVNRASRSS